MTTTADSDPAGLSAAERKAVLDQQIAEIVRKPHRTIEHRSDFAVIVARGKPVNHILHLLLTVVTMGLWALVWLAIALGGGVKRAQVEVTPTGEVVITQLQGGS